MMIRQGYGGVVELTKNGRAAFSLTERLIRAIGNVLIALGIALEDAGYDLRGAMLRRAVRRVFKN